MDLFSFNMSATNGAEVCVSGCHIMKMNAANITAVSKASTEGVYFSLQFPLRPAHARSLSKLHTLFCLVRESLQKFNNGSGLFVFTLRQFQFQFFVLE
jgi:hypothetical protein